MSTQTDPRTTTLVDNMMSAGVPRFEAIAIATSIEFALANPAYAAQYGTMSVDALNHFLDRLTP